MEAINPSIRAILWDFGGVFTTSPFEAFSRYEEQQGIPDGFIRKVNSTNPEDNAWAQFEADQISREQFGELFKQESMALGHPINGLDVLELLSGQLRPRMIQALELCKQHFKVGCITNNFKPKDGTDDNIKTRQFTETGPIMAMFDTIVESSIEGVRKPNPRIYEIACSRLEVTPDQCVFLDDLGTNLKSARAMGMTTIKVVDPDEALAELAAATQLTFS